MKRLIIHLKKVEKISFKDKKGNDKTKIFNTLNISFSIEKEKNAHLSFYECNIHKWHVINY